LKTPFTSLLPTIATPIRDRMLPETRTPKFTLAAACIALAGCTPTGCR